MAVLINVHLEDAASWAKLLQERLPEMRVIGAGEPFDPAEIDYVVNWGHEPGSLGRFGGLKAVLTIAAGVDDLIADPDLPNVPLVRAVDADLTAQMREWVILQVLTHHRNALGYRTLQALHRWETLPGQRPARQVRVGVMGLGELGLDAAQHLTQLGFDVAGWSRSAKSCAFPTYAGPDGLSAFLARSDILVCLLPLTEATKGILDHDLFLQLPRGAVLINAGRGGLQVEADILRALEGGRLSAASLDVFEVEPLPETSALWAHPRVIVTPHMAVLSDPAIVASGIAEQIRRHRVGLPFQHVVDRHRQY